MAAGVRGATGAPTPPPSPPTRLGWFCDYGAMLAHQWSWDRTRLQSKFIPGWSDPSGGSICSDYVLRVTCAFCLLYIECCAPLLCLFCCHSFPLNPPPPPPVGGVHLSAPGQRRGQLPSSVWIQHRAVKQGQSGGSVGTTSQGKGRGSREVRIGQAGRGRAQGGERPMGAAADGGKEFKGREAVSGERLIGAASCRQQHNQVSCHPPHPRTLLMA